MSDLPPGAPPVTETQPLQGEPRVCPLAVVSLVLGVLLCLGCVTGVPAVVCGHIALGQIRRAGGALTGRGLAIGGLVTGYASIALTIVMALVMALAMPARLHARDEACEVACASNLHTIGSGCMQYAETHDGRLPDRLSQLYRQGFIMDLEVFVCPATGRESPSPDLIDEWTDYEYVAGLATSDDVQSIVACDKDGNHRGGRNVLYLDGHVEWEPRGCCCTSAPADGDEYELGPEPE